MVEFHLSERERLLGLLLRHGILYASPTQPVRSRDGTSARWMLDSLSVSLTPEGVELAGKALLALLDRFEGRQVATFGVTAIPLLTSCVLQSRGRLRGLVVRKERKPYGSSKLIEGQIDPDEPVILLDDSVSSGTAMTDGCARLEESGLWVEGGICLVRFGWYGGFALMQQRGLHMESVFDIWDDFIYRMEGEPDAVPNPTKVFPAFSWSGERAPEGLHPARLARLVMEAFLETGTVLRPPAALDADYDSAGGAWVSLRDRDSIYLRHAREGFWHFPEDDPAGEPFAGRLGDPARDLVLAAYRTAAKLPAGAEGLRQLATGVLATTFFSRLELCTVGQLDNDRYGIVVRSRERLGRMGGALPRMPGIRNAWQQFEHARRKNGRLITFEPYDLFRHDLVKVIEPGAVWQPTGTPRPAQAPWFEDAEQAGQVALRARELVLAALGGPPPGPPLPADFLPELDTVFISVYVRGHLRGCMGSAVRQLDADLDQLGRLALGDARFVERAIESLDDVAVTASLLHRPLTLGSFSPQEVMDRVRLGQQALMAFQGSRSGLLLPFVAAASSLTAEAYALEVIDKAGITRPPYHWRRWECATWLADAGPAPRRLEGALPVNPPPPPPAQHVPELAGLLADYLVRQQEADGTLFFRYRPHQDVAYRQEDLPRLAHAAWVLSRAARVLGHAGAESAARRLIDFLLRRVTCVEPVAEPLPEVEGVDPLGAGHWWLGSRREASSISEVSFLLLALCVAPAEMSDDDRAIAAHLAATLRSRIDRHGRLLTHRQAEPAPAEYQDFFPLQALLALAVAGGAGVTAVPAEGAEAVKLRKALRYYRHRFRYRRHFGQVSWVLQAFAAWYRLDGRRELADFVFEAGDWALAHQQERDGGLLSDLQPDGPGFTTALLVEGMGAAAGIAAALGEGERARRYRQAGHDGLRYLDRLVIRREMASLLPKPEWAVGGVRLTPYRDEVRIDFVQHALSAALDFYPTATAEGPES